MIQASVVYRSLISRSPVIRFGMWIGLAITLLSLCFSTVDFAVVFAGLMALGLGVSIQSYRNWEGSAIIPEFRRTQSIAAIQMGFTLIAIPVLFGLIFHGWSTLFFGGVFCVVGTMFLLGQGNAFVACLYVVPITLLVLASPFINLGELGYEYILRDEYLPHVVGFLLFSAGAISLAYAYWNSNASPEASIWSAESTPLPAPTTKSARLPKSHWTRIATLLTPFDFRKRDSWDRFRTAGGIRVALLCDLPSGQRNDDSAPSVLCRRYCH